MEINKLPVLRLTTYKSRLKKDGGEVDAKKRGGWVKKIHCREDGR